MAQNADYARDGYIILPQLLGKNEIDTIESFIDPIYDQWKQQHTESIFTHKLVNMHSLTLPDYCEGDTRVGFFNAIANESLIKCLTQLFGTDIYFHNTQLFFNPTNIQRLPYWHRDMQYSQLDDELQAQTLSDMLSLHVRIPLEDEAGIAVIPGTHLRWDTSLEHDVRFELNGHRNSDPLPNERLLTLTRGDVLVFSSQMIHRGHYSARDTRKAFDVCVGTYHPYTAQFLDPKVLPTKEELKQIKHNRWYDLAQQIVS